MRIPADVERLMWLVAESNDPQAIADFETRFPDYRYELAQRRRMVADLKGAKGGKGGAEIPIPSFQPRQPAPAVNPKQVWIAASLGLAALAVASYSITQWATNPTAKPTPPPVVRTDPVQNDPGNVVYKPFNTPPQQQPVEQPTQQQPSQVQQPQPAGEQPKTVKMSNTSLVAALKMIGAESGYNVDIAPGFRDQQVSLDYQDVTPSEILKDLGRRYSFTAFDQGDGTIIVVPAVDDGSVPSDSNDPQRHLGG